MHTDEEMFKMIISNNENEVTNLETQIKPSKYKAKENKESISLAYKGNIVDLWERIADRDIFIDIGSDQTSLHNPWSGGYYPVGISFMYYYRCFNI